MDIDSYNKLPYKERLAMAKHVQDFVSQLKAQHFDPWLDYAFAEDFTADFPLPDTAVNREPAKIILINSVTLDLADKRIRPVNTNILNMLWHMEGKKSVLEEAEARIERTKARIIMKTKKKGLIP